MASGNVSSKRSMNLINGERNIVVEINRVFFNKKFMEIYNPEIINDKNVSCAKSRFLKRYSGYHENWLD